MANAGSAVTVPTTGTTIFNHKNGDKKCSKFLVGVRSTSANPTNVRVAGLHGDTELMGIPVGVFVEFQLGDPGIANVYVEGDGGDTVIDYGVTGNNLRG